MSETIPEPIKTADGYPTPKYAWTLVAFLTIAYISSFLDRWILGLLIDPIKESTGASDTQMGFLVGITFALFYATLGMPIAMLADRTNRRNIITAAITVWSFMTVLCGYVANFLQLTLARIGVGVGEGFDVVFVAFAPQPER